MTDFDPETQRRVDNAVAAVAHLFTNGSLKTLPSVQLQALLTLLAAEAQKRGTTHEHP